MRAVFSTSLLIGCWKSVLASAASCNIIGGNVGRGAGNVKE